MTDAPINPLRSRRQFRQEVRNRIEAIPLLGVTLAKLGSKLFPSPRVPFEQSAQYWERQYAAGGDSGPGSYGRPAEFKAKILNDLVRENDIKSVIEWGSGDGAQLSLAAYPRYVGIDVSDTAIKRCRKIFAHDGTKDFYLASEKPDTKHSAELALSLDVIYHLVEDDVYERYMIDLFESATRFVAIYAWDVEIDSAVDGGHVRHRAFIRWIMEHIHGWKLLSIVNADMPKTRDNVSFATFYIFESLVGCSR